MYCPYKNRKELIEWLVRYKGYTRSQASKCSTKQLYFLYYNAEKIFTRKDK